MSKRDPLMRFLSAIYRPINMLVPWHKIPYRLFVLTKLSPRLWNLPALRHDLRERNLYDTSRLPVRPEPPPGYPPVLNPAGMPLANPFRPVTPFKEDYLQYRTADGSYNDLNNPQMGRLGSRYGRNFPFEQSYPNSSFTTDPMTPRQISEELMLRDQFRPATSLNLLAAAWIQFNVHDWARHITDGCPHVPFTKIPNWNDHVVNQCPHKRIEVPLDATDNWSQRINDRMVIDRTLPDATRPPGCPAGPPTFLADGTFWWDGSQIYGSEIGWQHILRAHSDGQLKLTAKGHTNPHLDDRLQDLPEAQPFLPKELAHVDLKPYSGIDLTGFPGGWWAGLSVLHTLFAREHNAICKELIRRYGWKDDERLFQTARMINAALMAKIHTVEWTPAILGMPALKIGMDSNWWGVLGEQFRRKVGRLGDSEALSGIPGSSLDHHGVPYALTEEFVSVYRLHPLIPDEFRFHSLGTAEYAPHMDYHPHEAPHTTNRVIVSNFDHIQGLNTRQAIDVIGMENVIYSFGLAHPGAIALRNYPHFLRNYRSPDQPDRLLDVATIDVLRDRERGVPRYNRFRELLRMPRVRTFDQLNPRWADKLAKLYRNIDEVDTMVGLLGEQFPEGFGFSDTAFRIFILMASRRLKSDRFFTTDYRPEIYTQAGIDWINDNGFESVLLRHYPALAPSVQGLANPFHPWRSVSLPVERSARATA